jgi:hypothetical protein
MPGHHCSPAAFSSELSHRWDGGLRSEVTAALVAGPGSGPTRVCAGHSTQAAWRRRPPGVMRHPLVEQSVLAFVTYGRVKLANPRVRPQLTVTFRSGWQWVAVEGHAQLIGPDDPHPAIDTERLRLLLREAFEAAGGSHDDWAEYDRVMAEQRRTMVLIEPVRIYSN